MKYKVFEMFDYLLILMVGILITMGILFIYSSSINSTGTSVTNEYVKQIIWASIGLVIMVFCTVYDYRRLENNSPYLYVFLIAILVYTRIFGKYVNGAKSWIGIGDFGIQPSEFGKIFYILFLARYLDISRNERPLRRFVIAALIMLLPMGLILIQPDMGTASVYIPVFIFMCFMAGIPLRYLLFVLCFGMGSVVLAILPVWNSEIARTPHAAVTVLTNFNLRLILMSASFVIMFMGMILRRYFHAPKYVYWISYAFGILSLSLVFSLVFGKFLKDYQIKRLIIFIDPSVDRLGAGWNIIQSKVAIGAGGMRGQGYLNGTQSHYRFLPQQSTDFIFSILSEESGFLGGLAVFLLYFLIFVKILLIIRSTPNKFGMYIASGILGMFSFHFFINVGMVMGIMPITGIPLLFLSYGGSSLLSAMACVGFLMSINYRKKDLM